MKSFDITSNRNQLEINQIDIEIESNLNLAGPKWAWAQMGRAQMGPGPIGPGPNGPRPKWAGPKWARPKWAGPKWARARMGRAQMGRAQTGPITRFELEPRTWLTVRT